MSDRPTPTPQILFESWVQSAAKPITPEAAFTAGLASGLLIGVTGSNKPEAQSLLEHVFR